jgi:hypothetical protein
LTVSNGRDMKRLLDLQEEIFSEEIVKILNVLVIIQKVTLHSHKEASKWVSDLNEKIG